ncbi:MAG: conjugal transfer protein TraN [Zoogloeaceae bacterium]|nr:conjugal transfer protein TraN [Zoogloeaceae bacterium]
MNMMECDEEDYVTGAKRGVGLCHKVGSWCSATLLGGCEEKREGWCCFPSKLARIIQEQGRTQLGKPWGDPEEPDCSGFTEEEFQKIDFDKIDFSEFIGDIMKALPSKSESYAAARANQRAVETAAGLGNYYTQGISSGSGSQTGETAKPDWHTWAFPDTSEGTVVPGDSEENGDNEIVDYYGGD